MARGKCVVLDGGESASLKTTNGNIQPNKNPKDNVSAASL